MCSDFDWTVPEQPMALVDAVVHEHTPEARAACCGCTYHAADGHVTFVGQARWQKACVHQQFTVGTAAQEVVGLLVLAVAIEVWTVLFHNENFLAQGEDLVKLIYGELLKGLAGKLYHGLGQVVSTTLPMVLPDWKRRMASCIFSKGKIWPTCGGVR